MQALDAGRVEAMAPLHFICRGPVSSRYKDRDQRASERYFHGRCSQLSRIDRIGAMRSYGLETRDASPKTFLKS
jgi:hypothetical protein